MQDLDRNGAIHLQMPCTIDRAHAARAKAFLDAILLVERPAYKGVLDFDHLLFNAETDHGQIGRVLERFVWASATKTVNREN